MTLLKPWAVAKEVGKSPDNKAANPKEALLQESIYTFAESLRITGILLQPFMPSKAAELLDHLGVAKDKRQLEDATWGGDYDYGVPLVALGKDGLFPPMVLNN